MRVRGMARALRQKCTRCGRGGLQWCLGSEAEHLIGGATAVELLAQLPPWARDDAEVWHCLRCGEAGAFGAPEFGSL